MIVPRRRGRRLILLAHVLGAAVMRWANAPGRWNRGCLKRVGTSTTSTGPDGWCTCR